jgi:bleomycin hydrolase
MKRKSREDNIQLNKRIKIDADFINDCHDNFTKSDSNIILKNAITNVGSLYVTTDHEESNKISHVFVNSIKKKNLKATNQGSSGRCWIFSGLNVFRHFVIEALNLENFEFSESYLFFWDKFERSNTYLHWFLEYISDKETIDQNDNFFNFLTDNEQWMSDGGYWNYFSNLVEKYGIIPKTAMPETVHSEFSQDMNEVLMDILHSSSLNIFKNKKKGHQIIDDTMKQIYSTLVKFLGEPPKSFSWSVVDEEQNKFIVPKLEPHSFKDMVIPGIDLNSFVVLVNIPSKNLPYYEKYLINNTNNIIEGKCFEMINLPIQELKKYCKKSILTGIPVWFGADVNKAFNPLYSSLNEKINNTDLVFGKTYRMDKESRFLFNNQQTCHAMTLTGVNHENKDVTWQVENSWGYFDNQELGKDGFLCMTDKWFDEYVGQVVIHKKFLSRSITKIIDSPNYYKKLNAWESITPACKINSKQYYKYDLHKKI